MRIGRIWADGQAVDQAGLTWRLHTGSEDQLPDPLIAAIEGQAPAYRGTAYVVFENLDLTPYGNRIPQFNFEVFRRPAPGLPGAPRSPALDVRGVALVPGTGRVRAGDRAGALAARQGRHRRPERAQRSRGPRSRRFARAAGERAAERTLGVARGQLVRRRPALRPLHGCARPSSSGTTTARRCPGWFRGRTRSAAEVVSRVDGRPLFGGTPADAVGAAGDRADEGERAVGNVLSVHPDGHHRGQRAGRSLDRRAGPARWCHGAAGSRWRKAPGRPGSADKTAAAADEVEAFFGQAAAGDFHAEGRHGRIRRPGGMVVSPVRAALCASLRAGRRCGRLLHRVGDARADADPRRGRRLSGRAGAVRSRGGRPGDPRAGDEDRLCRRLVGVFRSSSRRRVGRRALFISTRCGRRPRSTSSGSTTTCRSPTGGTEPAMPMPRLGRSMTSTISAGNVAGGEGFDWYYADAAGRDAQDRACRSSTARMARTGSSATRTWSAGGRTRTSTGSAA